MHGWKDSNAFVAAATDLRATDPNPVALVRRPLPP